MGITLNNYMNGTNTSDLTSLYENDINYMTESIKFTNELNRDYYRERSNFIKSIYESGNNEELLIESFEGFFGNIKKIIDKFLAFIKKMVDQFIIQLSKFMFSDKYIKKNKEAFNNFTSEDEFEYTGFIYTFDKDIPLIFAESEFRMDFENILNPDYLIQSNRDKLQIKLKDGYYDKFRAEVLCRQNEIIYEEDFEKELYEEYRDNTSEKDPITINKEIINICLYRFLNYSDLEKQVKSTKSDIEKQYNNIKSFIKNDFDTTDRRQELINRFDEENTKTNNKISIKEIDTQFNLLISMKTDQVMKMSNIHTLSFGSKLEAMKSCLKQDKDILYGTLNKLAKRGELK